jgi:cell division septal protein FtsQ
MTSAQSKTYDAGSRELRPGKLTGAIHYALMAFTSCTIAYAVYFTYTKSVKAPIFQLEHIHISGLPDSLERDVRTSLKSFLSQPLYDISMHAIMEKLLSHVLIQKAVVMKQQPNRLHIEASAQVPYAIWHSSKPILVDSSGAYFREKRRAELKDSMAHLPRIVTKNRLLFQKSLELLKRHETWPEAIGPVTLVLCDPILGCQVHFEKGLKVFLLIPSLEAQWEKMGVFLKSPLIAPEDIAELHFEGDATLKSVSVKWRNAKNHNPQSGSDS